MTDRLVLLLLVGCLAVGSMIFVELQLTGTEDPAVPEAAARPQFKRDLALIFLPTDYIWLRLFPWAVECFQG